MLGWLGLLPSTQITNYDKLLNDINDVSSYLENVLLLDECKTIDNIQKVETSFICKGVDAELDNKIITLMDSEDKLEACRAYFSGVISNYEKKSISIYEAETKTTPLRKVNYSDEFVNILDMKNGMYQIFRKKTNEKFWIDLNKLFLVLKDKEKYPWYNALINKEYKGFQYMQVSCYD